MTSGLAICFRIETDALRRCAYLHRQTAGLRAAAAAVRAVRAAGAHFPSSVLGGELLGLMSGQFRDLLAQPNGRRGASYSREARREFGAPEALEPGDASWTGTMREKPPSAVFEPGRTGLGRAPFESDDAARVSGNGGAPVLNVPRGSSASPTWESPASGDVAQFSWPGEAPPAGKRGRVEPAGALAVKLREYWELAGRTTLLRAAAPRATEQSAGEQRAVEPESKFSANILRFGQTTFAQRLQSFVSGGGEPPEHTALATWRETAESAPDAPGPRTISEPTAGTALSGDFAGRLADTLRSQAMQHGIDLT